MEDDLLHKFRKEPRPAFAKSLYERINKPMNNHPVSRKNGISWKFALAGVTALMAVALIVSPAARALAQDFLNLFRVKRFAAVTIDTERAKQLQSNQVGLEQLLSASTEIIKKPGEPVTVDSPQAAGELAGFTVRVPTQLPKGTEQPVIMVQNEASARITADNARIQSLLELLGITDVQLPPELDGKVVTINKPPLVMLRYGASETGLMLLQSHNPQVDLPAGVDLPQLGEIALRVAGMNAEDARQFARNVDWSSTLLVPVPADASSFREVEVHGAKGLLITTEPKGKNAGSGSVLMWAEGDMVYALSGASSYTLADIANSIK